MTDFSNIKGKKTKNYPHSYNKARNRICVPCCLINQRRPVNYRKTMCEYFKESIPNTLCMCFLKDLVVPSKAVSLTNHVPSKPIKILDYRNVLQTLLKK